MSSSRKSIIATLACAAALSGLATQAFAFEGIGRTATPKEVAAWDIDVRPDFKGLPKGSGTVDQGMEVWEARCEHCHGTFGDSNEVFSPIVGGIQPGDIKTGRVANLTTPGFPGRTTFMKVPTISTIWDYVNRAMPWTEPKSLKPDEVYAVVNYLMYLNGIVPQDFVLNEKTIHDAQARMPNRNGMTHEHAMWPGKEFSKVTKPDTNNTACMKDCVPEVKVSSMLPDYARNAHGNLAEQNRLVGAQKGADTTQPVKK
ncbi:MAG: hypothetical protein RLZZ397_1370 [Pseudomonadota bacterium]|jgi:cytochrome c